ncbi:MAG: TonB-dependent siderophore receptor [Ramlibacter sp.]
MAKPSPIMRPCGPLSRVPLAVASLFLAAGVAQGQDVTTLKPVIVTGSSSAPVADVTGFGDVPLKDVPVSATVIDRRQIESSGARRLADLTRFDASVSDAYNAPGYWDFISIRGFTLDNRFNYRREGLPISAETTIPLDDKERVEILKGTSGIQAGTSAPGGLVNYVVKRPTENNLREVRLELTARSSALAAIDLGGRFGADQAFGYRLNVAQERLRPLVRNLDGERSLLALATDWRISRDSLLAAEVEWSRKSQPSQVGFSLLGNTLPAPADPRLNLNNQPWSKPSVFDALTGTLRFDQALNADWRWSAQAGTQRLKTDDRTAFPFGCSDANGVDYYADRYCPDGTFDLWDFRSENEKRRQEAASLSLKGKFNTSDVAHDLSLGLMGSRVRNRFEKQAFNFAGTGNIAGTAVVDPNPIPLDESTNRDERSVEFSVQDAIRWNDRLTTWLGLRYTRLNRDSIRTDGSRGTSYDQNFTTPWVAVSYRLAPAYTLYASHGRGVESEVAPNNGRYANSGQPLPALKSRQTEVGVKGETREVRWSAAWFDIVRPLFGDAGACDMAGSCTRQVDGEAHHRGLELTAGMQAGPWTLDGGATWLDAKRRGGTIDPSLNGKRPINVPGGVVRASVAYRVAAVPGLTVQALASHEGKRTVLADESITLPAWTRFDAALRYETQVSGTMTSWTLGIDNLANKRYWKEAPYQFGHVYLYPGAPRTLRLSLTAAL